MTSEWHPIFLTTETSPGVWEMQRKTDYGPFGTIELRRVSESQCRYKVTFRGNVIGWSTTLQLASENLYRAYVDYHSRAIKGAPNKHPDDR